MSFSHLKATLQPSRKVEVRRKEVIDGETLLTIFPQLRASAQTFYGVHVMGHSVLEYAVVIMDRVT